jgi:phosphoribosyl 1,2-cyclic phosphodiesterase
MPDHSQGHWQGVWIPLVRFASLGSGSRGNATLVEAGATRVLVDCGFSARETERRLSRLGVEANQLDAILVTHEHNDHCSGVAPLSRKHDIPVYLTHGTWASDRCAGARRVHYFHSESAFEIGDIRIAPIAVPHDAREPCQFVLEAGSLRLGILTDLGSITTAVLDHYQGCDGLLLECNHDLQMLNDGPYPPALKRRVAGNWGHLNNLQSASLLAEIDLRQLQHLVVAHLSEQNNHHEHVSQALLPVLGDAGRLRWADQQQGLEWLLLD